MATRRRGEPALVGVVPGELPVVPVVVDVAPVLVSSRLVLARPSVGVVPGGCPWSASSWMPHRLVSLPPLVLSLSLAPPGSLPRLVTALESMLESPLVPALEPSLESLLELPLVSALE